MGVKNRFVKLLEMQEFDGLNMEINLKYMNQINI